MLHRWLLVFFCFPWLSSYADTAQNSILLAQAEKKQEGTGTLDPRRAMQHKYMKSDEDMAENKEKVPSFDIECPNHKKVQLNIFFTEKGWEFSPASMIPETFDKGYARLKDGSKRNLQASCLYRVNTKITATHAYTGQESCPEDREGGIVAVNYSSIEGYSVSKIGSDEPGVLLGKKIDSKVHNKKRLACTYTVKGLVNLYKDHTADMDVKACRSRGVKISCK